MSIFEWDIAVSENNKMFLIKNKKLLYQHSEITVLISFMTPYPSTSLSLATGLLLSITSRSSNHVFFQMAARKHV